MKVTAYGEEYDCTKAVKGADFIRLYDGNMEEYCVFGGINSFEGYEITGGEWSVPEKTDKERIAELEETLAGIEGKETKDA